MNTGDVKPTLPPVREPLLQYSTQPVWTQPPVYGHGLRQAVYNAKNFVATTFEGAVLMDEHQVE